MIDLGALRPGHRLPWRGKVWTVQKWATKAHPASVVMVWAEPKPVPREVPAYVEPILCLRAEDGKRARLSPYMERWPQFCRDMEGVWMVTQPHCRGTRKCPFCAAGIGDEANARGLDITALPWLEDA